MRGVSHRVMSRQVVIAGKRAPATDITDIRYFAVITDNLVIPAFSIEAMARATSP